MRRLKDVDRLIHVERMAAKRLITEDSKNEVEGGKGSSILQLKWFDLFCKTYKAINL